MNGGNAGECMYIHIYTYIYIYIYIWYIKNKIGNESVSNCAEHLTLKWGTRMNFVRHHRVAKANYTKNDESIRRLPY